MIYTIIDSTDNQYLGRTIEISENTIAVIDDMLLSFDKVTKLDIDKFRFSSSNYIIDVKVGSE
jgi:hypothetical protein